jgi:hypothetical protein
MTQGKAPAYLNQFRSNHEIPDDKAIRLWNGLEDMPNVANDFYMGISQPEWVQKAHNTRSGRVVISGTGPSLAKQKEMLPQLFEENEVWTVNRSKWFFRDQLKLIPDVHLLTEPSPVGDWGKVIWDPYDFPEVRNRIAIHWFPVTAPGWMWAAKAHDDVQVRWQGTQGMGEHMPPIPTAWASPLTSVQLALWFGFTEIALCGVDTTQDGQAWNVETGRTANARSIESIKECADRMKHEIKLRGRVIYDMSTGGRLNQDGVLDYVEMGDILGTPTGRSGRPEPTETD